MASRPSSSRYRRRCETRNGGGAGGAETIRAAPGRARAKRGFDAPTTRPFDQKRLSAREESHRESLWPDATCRLSLRGDERLEKFEDIREAFHVEAGRGGGEAHPD